VYVDCKFILNNLPLLWQYILKKIYLEHCQIVNNYAKKCLTPWETGNLLQYKSCVLVDTLILLHKAGKKQKADKSFSKG
jgi:hypothetical protein